MNEIFGAKLNAKTILVLSGRANTGKTQTIKEVYRLLTEAYPKKQITWIHPADGNLNDGTGDICVIVEINGVFIGIESQGDPNSRLPQSLKIFAECQPLCGIILCATRTRGKTCQAVTQLHTTHNYNIVWIPKKLHRMNDKCANHILALIENLLARKEAQP